MSVSNATAQSMVNSGQVSPAAGAAGGILGALVVAAIDAGVDANRNGKINQMLEGQSFDAQAVFETALLDALKNGNITPAYQKEAVRPDKDEFFTVSASPDAPLDAAMDVIIYQYGFTIDSIGWRPSISAQVQLHDTHTGELLMNEFVSYGRLATIPPTIEVPGSYSVGIGQPTIIVPFDPSNNFANVNAYTRDDPARAAATLTKAMEATAQKIASLIVVAAPPVETVMAAADPAPQDEPAAVPDDVADPVPAEDASEPVAGSQ